MNVDLEVKANFLQIFQSAITAIFCHLIRHLNPISSCNGNYNDLLCGDCQQNLKTNHRKDFPSNIIIVLVEFLFKKVFKRNFPYKVLLLKTYTELCGGGAGGGGWEMMKRITNYDLAVSSLQRNQSSIRSRGALSSIIRSKIFAKEQRQVLQQPFPLSAS